MSEMSGAKEVAILLFYLLSKMNFLSLIAANTNNMPKISNFECPTWTLPSNPGLCVKLQKWYLHLEIASNLTNS